MVTAARALDTTPPRGIALTSIAASMLLQEFWLTALGMALGYAIALASHRLVDGSKSLVTVNPAWGAAADSRCAGLP